MFSEKMILRLVELKNKLLASNETEVKASVPHSFTYGNYWRGPRISPTRKKSFLMPSKLPEYLDVINRDGKLYSGKMYDTELEYYVDGKKINMDILNTFYEVVGTDWHNKPYRWRLKNPDGKYGCHIKVCRHFYNRAELLEEVEKELNSRRQTLKWSNAHNEYVAKKANNIIHCNNQLLALLG